MIVQPNKDLVAAYHEAGHAVGAFLLGVPVDNVSIDLGNNGEGSVHSRLTIAEIRQLNLAWQYAIVAMLGREAERMVFGRADRRYLGNDAATIAGLYLTFFKNDMSCQHFRAELRDRTAAIVAHPRFRDAIDALANVVSVEKVVEESHAIELIQSVVSRNASTKPGTVG